MADEIRRLIRVQYPEECDLQARWIRQKIAAFQFVEKTTGTTQQKKRTEKGKRGTSETRFWQSYFCSWYAPKWVL